MAAPGFAAVLDDVRATIRRLAELADDPAAKRLARALDRWLLSGESLDSALDLPSDWRLRERLAARDAALAALAAMHRDLDDSTLARHILDGLPADTSGRRGDGEAGLLLDLARLEPPRERHLRRLIGKIRGQHDEGNGHVELPSSGATRPETSKDASPHSRNTSVATGARLGPPAAASGVEKRAEGRVARNR